MIAEDIRRSFMVPGYERSPYEHWAAEQGIPSIRGLYVDDLYSVHLEPWEQKGGRGTFINLDGTGYTNDAYIVEIPAAGELNAERHLFEEFIYVLTGRGATAVWVDGKPKRTVEWQAGSVFSLPINTWSQHFNLSGTEPARFMSVTTAPLMLDLFHNQKFIFDNPFVFEDRFSGEEERYFSGEGIQHPGRVWETNYVPDVNTFKLQDWKERGAGGTNVFFELANSTTCAHISEFPVGTYKKGHRHGPGAHVILLSGQGYTLLWKDNQPRVKVPWQRGTMFVPPDMWFHQHFNTGPEPARYLAIRWGSSKFHLFNYFGVAKDVKEGGDQIEYEDEDPAIRREFEEELARNGVASRMKDIVGW